MSRALEHYDVPEVMSPICGGGQGRAGAWLVKMRILQGHFAYKKIPRPRNPQQNYAYGPMVDLGGGRFLMSEVIP